MRSIRISLFIVLCLLSACDFPKVQSLIMYEQQLEHGKQLFYTGTNTVPACSICHVSSKDEYRLYNGAPQLVEIGQRAGNRQPAMNAVQYLHESMVNPGAYLVSGFPNGMYQNYGDHLTEYDIDSLILFLLSL